MTVIEGLARLETTALWRPEAGAQRREVYVAIGEAELVVQDAAGTALTHWSLPALVRVGSGEGATVYAPTEGADETLEVSDPDMIDALDRVVAAVRKGRARPGSLRRVLLSAGLAAAAALAVIWLPGALRERAAAMLPAVQRAEIGQRMLAELALLTGPPCETPEGRDALSALRARVLPSAPARIAVLRGLPHPALALPGGIVALSDASLGGSDDPDVAAGHVLAAWTGAAEHAPLAALLEGMPLSAVMRLLTEGAIPEAEVTRAVEARLVASPSPPPEDRLREAFAAADLGWEPWAMATGRDPGPEAAPRPAALSDQDWQALRGICDG